MKTKTAVAIFAGAALVGGLTAWYMFAQSPTASLELTSPDVSSLRIPDGVKIVGVGEASHGSKEYQELKGEVFKTLVAQGKAKTFAIEGDFGGSLVVNDYIHGGEGTAADAAAAIGFGIYRTEEIASIIQWMRDYNDKAEDGDDLNFMGFDFQRVDASKAYISRLLNMAAPALLAKYKPTLDIMNDDNRLDVAKDDLTKIKTAALGLVDDMDAAKDQLVAASDEDTVSYARQAAVSIAQYMDALLVPEAEYNSARDPLMRDKIKWLVERDGDKVLYINAHNGHVQKINTSGYDPLGKYLADDYGDSYYVIGSDAGKTSFNSQTDDGFRVVSVSLDSGFTSQLKSSDREFYFVEFSKVKDDPVWQQIIHKDQAVTALNVFVLDWQTYFSPFYAVALNPSEAFDAMAIYKEVHPSTLLD